MGDSEEVIKYNLEVIKYNLIKLINIFTSLNLIPTRKGGASIHLVLHNNQIKPFKKEKALSRE